MRERERAREREKDRETERETEKEGEGEKEREERERELLDRVTIWSLFLPRQRTIHINRKPTNHNHWYIRTCICP